MRKLFTYLLLTACVLVSGSFITLPEDDNGHYKNTGYFFAILNGNMFEMRDDDKYRAELVNKTGTMKNNSTGELNRVATSLIFYGNNFIGDDGKPFTENIDFEYSFENGALGEPNDLKIEIHYDKNDYYHEPNQTKFRVTKIEWTPDRRAFYLSADFDCKMRKWGFPRESMPIVRLKGRMVNVEVTVPAWIKLKDPGIVAGN